jgi:CubicO group peptidase (beta-lactamase class C family)
MKRILLTIWAFCLLAMAGAQTVDSKMEQYLRAAESTGRFHGAVLVSKNGKVLVDKGYGWMNAESKAVANQHTRYQIGSVTKQFTATIILKLAEQGKLTLSDKLEQYFPGLPNGKEITIEHLLTHTSGLYNYTNSRKFMDSASHMPATQAGMLAWFRTFQPDFSPGEKFSYSNTGYMMLGYISEKVSGKSYESLVREMIFRPLGMDQSGFDFTHLVSPDKAKGYYALVPGQVVPAKIVDSSVSFSAGAIYSTTADLYKWNRSLFSGSLLTPEAYQNAFTPRKDRYALGWFIDSVYGRRRITHDGGIDGFLAHNTILPQDQVTVTVLSNSETWDPSKIGKDLLAILFEQPYAIPSTRKSVPVNENILASYAGDYEIRPDFILTVFLKEGKFKAKATGQPEIDLYAEDDNLFYPMVFDADITFGKDASGKVDRLILKQGGQTIEAKKIK